MLAPAAAAPASAQQDAEEAAPTLEDLALMLGSSSPEELRQAIEAAAVLGDPTVVSLLEQRIREGLPPDLLAAALDSLSLLNDPSSLPLLQELSVHRREAIRVRAIQGLAALGGAQAQEAEPALQRALADQSSQVRSAAAVGLGELGVKAALPSLFVAFERGVQGSGAALAKLAGPQHLDRILGYLGAYPFETVAPVLLGLAARPDWKDPPKLRIVVQVQEIATADARAALERIAALPPEQASARVRQSAASAATRISDRGAP